MSLATSFNAWQLIGWIGGSEQGKQVCDAFVPSQVPLPPVIAHTLYHLTPWATVHRVCVIQ